MKELIYFSHDLNARNDAKLQKLRMKYNIEGLGIYWCLVEMLYEESGYIMLSECERIAYELRVDIESVKSIIFDYNLFKNDENKFWSDSILERMKKLADKSAKARKSALKRWNANAKRRHCDGNAKKESKVKEKKVKNTSSQKSILAHVECLKYFGEKFKEKYFLTYPASFQKDYSLLKKIISQYSKNECLNLIDIFFMFGDEWTKDKISVGVFYSQLPKLVIKLSELREKEKREE